MNKEQIIEGLKFTKEMFLLDPITNETMTKEQLNDMGRTTVDACEGAIELLEQEPKTGHWIADVDKWGDIVTTVNGYRCDKCNAFNSDKDNYCPNCGAKMD